MRFGYNTHNVKPDHRRKGPILAIKVGVQCSFGHPGGDQCREEAETFRGAIQG
jgi:hypothetical protein